MSVFSAPSYDHHESVHFYRDSATGLKAIIAVHNTRLGPATGGCRMFPYGSDEQALDDVLRLSRGMSLKSALAGLPLGGGKAVILADPQREKTPALLRSMGRFIDQLQGRYVSAEDSGISVADLTIMAEETEHVAGIISTNGGVGDPSPYTAEGVFLGLTAAARHCWGSTSTAGVKIAVQGAGAVGLQLIERLLADGAEVWACDIREENLLAAQSLGANVVSCSQIFDLDVDVFSPCALGGAINRDSLSRLKAKVIAGAANNQLLTPEIDQLILQKDIVYAPDFVINAGGIIKVHYDRQDLSDQLCLRHIRRIPRTLESVFAQGASRGFQFVAETMAWEKIRALESQWQAA